MSNKVHYATLVIPALLAACASTPQKPEDDPAYVSPTQYDTYSCSQMRAEMVRVDGIIEHETQSAKGSELLGTALAAYAISQGRGVQFGDDESVELRRAKTKYRILDEMMIKKNCTK
jgi:hypothetical protein